MSLDDDSDESIDMDDDMGSSDEESSGEGDDENEDTDSVEDENPEESGLLGFLAPSDITALRIGQPSPTPLQTEEEDSVDEEDELSLIPDASQTHATPRSTALSTAHGLGTDPCDQDAILPAKNATADDDDIAEVASRDRSSQPTPATTETKASEADSASSIELHQSNGHLTHSTTPPASTNLKTPIPFLLRGTLREYQHYGLDWLAGLYANNTNGILADEMGLGKTIQTIALLAHLACEHHVWGPHLVVVPTSVMLNWEMEFKKWCPGFKILTYYGNQDERKKKRIGWANNDSWNVCITSYQLVLQDQQVFKRKRWHYMILDEAHNIKELSDHKGGKHC